MDTLNKVYLFQFDQNTQKAKMLEIDEAGKNQIRSIWENHNKETMTMNLALILMMTNWNTRNRWLCIL